MLGQSDSLIWPTLPEAVPRLAYAALFCAAPQRAQGWRKMARAAHRDPTPRELDERLTRVERQVAEIATTITSAQEASVREAQQSRDAFIEHRAEVRKSFAEAAVRAEALRNDVAETHVIIHRLGATIEAGFKASFTQVADVRNELRADVAANRTELADLRNEMRAAFARLDAKLDRGPAE